MKKIVYLALILGLLASACSQTGSLEEQIPDGEPSATVQLPTPSDTPVPTEVPTETPLPSPTPDVRIIQAEPADLVLETGDLPEEGSYYISQDKGTLTNEMIVYNFQRVLGVDMADLVDQYLQETSRLDGYSQVWTRGNWSYQGPLYVANEIAIFKNANGAQLEVTKYKPLLIEAMDGRVPSHEEIRLGDETRIYLDTVISNGQEADVILVEFAYRNVVVDIGCFGEKGVYSLEDVLAIAERLLTRIQELPLTGLEP